MVQKCPWKHPDTTIFLFNIDPILTFNPICWCNSFFFLHFWSISEGYGPRDRHSWIRLEISCRTVWSRNSGLSRRPVSCTFCFQLRPPISGEHFFEPAPQFKSLPPPFVPPTSNPTPKSTPFVQTVSQQKRPKGCRHPSFFQIHLDNINVLTPHRQFSPGKPGGG